MMDGWIEYGVRTLSLLVGECPAGCLLVTLRRASERGTHTRMAFECWELRMRRLLLCLRRRPTGTTQYIEIVSRPSLVNTQQSATKCQGRKSIRWTREGGRAVRHEQPQHRKRESKASKHARDDDAASAAPIALECVREPADGRGTGTTTVCACVR
ncbi:uncharacterized protein BKA78DRAFT_303630 [Phyllosticta capitalensis]|uniref:uncharacterized protein n=1 Tax=Phyllosticta capitalensis TaxID=121624 RepID=UPI00312FF349